MANSFDPYREALVVEKQTVWPEELIWAPQVESERRAMEVLLHATPANAVELEYIRLAAGFIRKITVAETDLERCEDALP